MDWLNEFEKSYVKSFNKYNLERVLSLCCSIINHTSFHLPLSVRLLAEHLLFHYTHTSTLLTLSPKISSDSSIQHFHYWLICSLFIIEHLRKLNVLYKQIYLLLYIIFILSGYGIMVQALHITIENWFCKASCSIFCRLPART